MNPTEFDAILSLVGGKLSSGLTDDGKLEYTYHDGQKAPTQIEIDAELARLQAEYEAKSYQRDRQYPRLGEQLDMLFHDMTAGKGTKDGEWYKAVAKVKTDNPKPKE